MKLFNNNIVPYASTEGDKIYPIVVDIKKGIKSGEAISFVTADNQVGVITVDFMDGNSSYSIEGCMVTSTIRRPDGTVLEIPCDIIAQSTIEIPLGINGTYQEGVHTFDLKIVRGNGKVIGVPTMSYSVSGSLSSDDVVEGDDRLPVLTMVLDNAQDKLTRLDKAIAGATNDLEVKEARDGEVTLNARLERDLEKGKMHFVNVEGSIISTESEEGYLENVEIHGNTWQDANNLSDIRSVGTKVEGQELYEIPVLSYGKNLFNGSISNKTDTSFDFSVPVHICEGEYRISFTSNVSYSGNSIYLKSMNPVYNRFLGVVTNYNGRVSGNITINTDDMNAIKSSTNGLRFSIYRGDGISDIPTDILITQSDDLSYEPYQEDKLTILSPVQLEKVGDVADRIICKDGVWGVEKNVGTVVVDGSNNWYQASNKPTTAIPEYRLERGITNYYLKNKDNSCKANAISNKYNLLGSQSNIWVSTVEGFGVGSYNFYGTIYVSSTYTTLTEFKENLGDLTIKYQLAEPTFIPLPHDQQIKLRTFANKTNISFLTEIEGTIKAQVPKSLGATVNTHTTQIDNLNKELDRVKKLEESTVSTVTTDSSFTTVSETNQGYFEDVKIEGKTLVNLNDKFIHPITSWSIGTNWAHTKYTQFPNIKEGVTYTAIVYGNVSNVRMIRLGHANDASVTQVDMQLNTPISFIGKAIDSRGITLISQKSVVQETHTREELESLKLLILEGDHTDKDLSYFEGLKSVGQDNDEISVLSNNQNLYSENEFLSPLFPKEIINNKEYYVLKGTNTITDNNLLIDDTMFKFKENTRYTFTIKGMRLDYFHIFYVTYTDGTRSSVRYDNIEETEMTFTTLENKTIKNVFTDTGSPSAKSYILVNGICMKEGTDSTFVPRILNKKQILYFNPTTQTWEKPILREWDSIEKHSDGKYYYHKRSGEVVLNGSEDWAKGSTYENTIVFSSPVILNEAKKASKVYCDKINHEYAPAYEACSNEERIKVNNGGNIAIMILNSKLSTQDVQGFTAWLQANNVTVVYQLAQEEVYECANLDLITYSGETNLIVNSGAIQPKITLKVLSNVSNVVKLLQEKVSILENKFIEGLKQVLSGDMMSLAHLLYPEDFEHEIQTLEL